MRRSVFELLVGELNTDCSTCQLDGLCELQQLAKQFNVKLEKKSNKYKQDASSPVLVYDPNKCVKCFRCIKACDEIEGKGVLNFAYRGQDMYVVAGVYSADIGHLFRF